MTWNRGPDNYAWRRAQYGHSTSPSPATRMAFASLFTVFSTTVVHHSLLGASVVLQYMYLCSELWIRGWTYICNKHGWIWNKWLPTSKHVIFKLGITLHTVCESEMSAIYMEIRNISRIHYVCDQSPLHTWLSLENFYIRPPCVKFYHIKSVCDGQPLPHSFFYAPCVIHAITQTI